MKPISKYFNNPIPNKYLSVDNTLFQDFISKDFIKTLTSKLTGYSVYYSFSNQKADKSIFNNYVSKEYIFLKFYFLKNTLTATKSLLSVLKQNFINLGIEISNIGGKANSIGSYLTICIYQETNKLVITFGNLNLNLYSFTIEEHKTKFAFSVTDENSIKIKRYSRWTSLTMNTFFSFLKNEHVGKISHTISREILLKLFKLNNNNEYFANEYNFDIIERGIFLPKISLKEFRTISNKKDLLKRIFNVECLPKQFLNLDICEINFLYRNLKLASSNDWQKLLTFYINFEEKRHFKIYENDYSVFDFDFELLRYYYRTTFINNGSLQYNHPSQENILIKDYINLCKILSINVNLKMSSFKKLKIEHDRLALELVERDIEKRDIRIKEVYRKITFISLIETTDDLVLESKRQHHCVASYLQNIENGLCAIYTDVFESKRFTIEISYRPTIQSFILNQCKGVFNSEPPAEFLRLLRSKIKEKNEEIKEQGILDSRTKQKSKFLKIEPISQPGSITI